MAPLQHLSPRKVLLVLLLVSVFCISTSSEAQSHRNGRRKLLGLDFPEDDDDEPVAIKKKTTTTPTSGSKNQTKLVKAASSKNQTKLIKTSVGISSKNQTKLINSSASTKNQTKLIKTPIAASTKNQTKLIKTPLQSSTKNKTKASLEDQPQPIIKTSLKKLNSTKPTVPAAKKPADLTKNKTATTDKKEPKRSWPSWVDLDDADTDDLVSEFRTLPSKFQEQLLPDLERISKTSKVYLNRANKEITRGFKPYVGNKYAPTIASFVSFAFIIIPLILVSLIFNKIKTYFSLQKIIIFIQIYLSIYFSILCLSSLVTGLEPLKFFYATSQSTYVCLQVLQTLAYVLYLLLLLMYLVLVFSTDTALPTKMLGLGQTLVGYAVGLHYYVTVFHKTVLHQPPKTSWKIHAIYATCFLLICVLTRVDRRKKAYLDGDMKAN